MHVRQFATAAVAVALGSAPASAQLLDTGVGSSISSLGAGEGLGQGVNVSTATTLTQFGFYLGTPNAATSVKYLIWDGTSNSLAYSQVRTIASATADNTLQLTDPFSFALLAGRTYYFGIVADDALDVSYSLVSPTAITQNGLSITDPNVLFDGYAAPTTDLSPAGAQIALQLSGTQAASTVPEPGSLALVLVGLVGLGAGAGPLTRPSATPDPPRPVINTLVSRAARAGATASVLVVAGLAACSEAKNTSTGAIATSLGPTAAVDARTTTDCARATANPAKTVCLTNAFLNTLSSTQKTSVQFPLTSTYAVRWSNLPCGSGCRNGLQFSTLSAAQLAAAINVAKAALSASGYSQFNQTRLADDILAAAGSGGGSGPGGPGGPPGGGGGGAYSSGNYFIAVLGTPSTTAPWILQIGGHHSALNFAFNGTATPTPTPNFVGVEPQTFTTGGVTYTPLQSRKVAVYTMINSLSATQLASAQLGSSFTDVLLGPGQDGKFPTRQGIPVSSLSAAQQQLVKTAIEAWVKDVPTLEANNILAAYEDPTALASTYIANAGGTDSTKQGSYIRIDGPRVWIEFVCQNGVVFPSQIHFHTIWRDHTQDYGGDFTF